MEYAKGKEPNLYKLRSWKIKVVYKFEINGFS